MIKLTPKEKWLKELTHKARFKVNLQAYEEIISSVLSEFSDLESLGTSSDIICNRLGKPENVIAKKKEGKWCEKGIVWISTIALFIYFYIWCRSWHYNMFFVKILLLGIGTVLLPRIFEFLCGKNYYEICTLKLKRKRVKHFLVSFDWGVIACFLILGLIIFPLGIGKEVFSELFSLAWLLFFCGLAIFQVIYGMVRISCFRMDGHKLIYMGNGMLHSYFLLSLWCDLVYDKSLVFLFIGFFFVPLPIAIDMILLRVEQRKKNDRRFSA